MKQSTALFDPLRGLVRVAGMAQRGRWDSIWAELKGLRDGLLAPFEITGTNENLPGTPSSAGSSGHRTVEQLPPNQAFAQVTR